MNKKSKYLIPVFAGVFALTFAMAAPYVMAEGDVGGQLNWDMKHHGGPFAPTVNGFSGIQGDFGGHPNWDMKHHGGPFAPTVNGFSGSIQIPDNIDKETMKGLKDQISVSLVDAATAAENVGVDNVMKANIGMVQNENGDKFVAWLLGGITVENGNVTKNIFVVDAGNSGNTALVENQFDPTMMKENFADHHPFKANFGNLDNETKAEIQSAFQNLKDAKQSGDQTQIDNAKQALKSLLDSLKPEN